MRILQVMDGSDVDGVKNHIVSQAQAHSRDCEVCAISLCANPVSEADTDQQYIKSIACSDIQEIEHITKEFAPDVVYCGGSTAFLVCARLRKKCSIPIVAEVRTERQIVDASVQKFDFYLPDSEQIAKVMIRRGIRPEIIFMSADDQDADAYAAHILDCCAAAVHRFTLPKNRRDGFVICGAYGKGNTGDEAILQAIVQELRELDPDRPITIITRSPEEAKLHYRTNAIYTFRLDQVIRSFRRADVYINGGGSLIQDVTSSRSLRYYLLTLELAKRCGCKVMMYGCGIGPLHHSRNRKKAAYTINRSVDVITLRDRLSFHELKRMGIDRPDIHLSADPAFRLQPVPTQEVKQVMQRLGIPDGQNFIGVGLRDWTGLSQAEDAIAAALDDAYETHGLVPLFVPIEYPSDIAPAERISKKLHCPNYVVREQQSIALTIGLLAQTKAVMGVRLHSLLFAAAAGVPVIGISYDIKVDGFLDYIRSDTCVPFGAVTKEKLMELIAVCVSGQKQIEVREMAEELRQLEQENIRAARNMLERKL